MQQVTQLLSQIPIWVWITIAFIFLFTISFTYIKKVNKKDKKTRIRFTEEQKDYFREMRERKKFGTKHLYSDE